MRALAKIERWPAEYVYTHMRVAHHLFRSSHRHQMAQVAFWAEVASAVVEVHLSLCITSVSEDFLRCHVGKKGSRLFDFREPLPGVFRSQPSHCSAREIHHPPSSLLGLRREVSWLVVAFPPLQRVKTLLWPFWPYSRQVTCRTVQAVPDLLVFP